MKSYRFYNKYIISNEIMEIFKVLIYANLPRIICRRSLMVLQGIKRKEMDLIEEILTSNRFN